MQAQQAGVGLPSELVPVARAGVWPPTQHCYEPYRAQPAAPAPWGVQQELQYGTGGGSANGGPTQCGAFIVA